LRTRAALVAVLAAALVGCALPAGAGSAAASECVNHRHVKRVVRQVRRHGKPRRVVRWRRWWSCDAVAGAPAPSPAPVFSPPSEPEPTANRLGVKSAEYYFTLSRPEVHAGEVTVELSNQGEDAHDLNLQLSSGEGPVLAIAETASLQHNLAHFDLPAGTYKLWCDLPEHEERGMHTTLVVAP
jgi:plastocyanin